MISHGMTHKEKKRGGGEKENIIIDALRKNVKRLLGKTINNRKGRRRKKIIGQKVPVSSTDWK